MTITPAQLASRAKGIGSSDVAAMLGLDKYRSRYDLWLEKTGRVTKTFGGNEATRIGDAVESAIRDLASQRLGQPVLVPSNAYVHGKLRAHLDGQLGGRRSGLPPVECKAGWHGGSLEWGEDGSDQVPDKVTIQVHAQMICCGATESYVGRLSGSPNGGLEFSLYKVPINNDLVKMIVETADYFWKEYVESDISPPATYSAGTEGEASYLAQMELDSGAMVSLDPALINEYADAKIQADQAAEKAKTLRTRIMLEMGEATKCQNVEGIRLSKYTQTRNSLDVKALCAAHPEVAPLLDEFNLPGNPYAVLRLTDKR